MNERIIVILGPTSAGKTSLSIDTAKAVHGEIISADSRQVYKGLDIGSGKVTPLEMQGVPHHLIDVASPTDVFSASDFVRLGRAAIAEVIERTHIPIVVGGTGFYIDALLGTISLSEVPANPAFRFQLSGFSLEELNAKLQKLDPERAEHIDTKNPVRLIRAIEIAHALGTAPKVTPHPLYDVLYIGLQLDIDVLNTKIHERLLERLNNGMLEEAKRLHHEGLSFERMESLGLEYRFMARHLQGFLSYEEMTTQLESEIRKYAKRQKTWFKRNKNINWFAPADKEAILARVQKFLT